MADLIISQPMTFTVDVRNGLVERPQRESLMRGDKMANRIIAELMYGSEPFDITGVTVKGKFCRPPSGDEIDLAGEAKGNVAEVQLTDQCYTSGGHYEARVILVLGGVERTVLFISGDVLKSGSGNAASDEETGGSGGSTGSGLPAGGTAGQVLVKVSSAKGDAIWRTLTAADVGARPADWMPTASDVGALPSDGTAVNANALNGKDAVYYLGARNLLDNGNFKIAQAGYGGLHGNDSFACDRWHKYGTTAVEMTDAGLSLSFAEGSTRAYEAIWQYLGIDKTKLVGKAVTLAASVNGVVYCVSEIVADKAIVTHCGNSNIAIRYGASSGYVQLEVYNNESATVQWIALYEGEYTADNLPPYTPKGYAEEMAECQRYFYIPTKTGGVPFAGYAAGSSHARFLFILPAPMIRQPTISITDMSAAIIKSNAGQHTVTEVNGTSYSGQTIVAYVTTSGLTDGNICVLNPGEIIFSADI